MFAESGLRLPVFLALAGLGLRMSTFLGVLLLAQGTFTSKVDEVYGKKAFPLTEESLLDRVRRDYLFRGKLTVWRRGEEDLLKSVFSEGQGYPTIERSIRHGHKAGTRPLRRCKRGERGCKRSSPCNDLGLTLILYKPSSVVGNIGKLVIKYQSRTADPLALRWKIKKPGFPIRYYRFPEKRLAFEPQSDELIATENLAIYPNWSIERTRMTKSQRKRFLKEVKMKLFVRSVQMQKYPCQLTFKFNARSSSETKRLWPER